MESVLDQFDNTEATPTTQPKKKTPARKDSPEVEEKREQLSILAVLGTIETYTGIQMSLGDVKKLSS